MNTIFLRHGFVGLLSFASLTVMGSGSSAVAQIVESTETEQLTQSFPNQITAEADNQNQNLFTPTFDESPASTVEQAELFHTTDVQPSQATVVPEATKVVTPIPGTAPTTSAAFIKASPESAPTSQPSATKVAQSDISIGRTTRGGRSYVGIGANIGLNGETALGDGNFTILSKIGITRNISVRPSAILGDDTVILVPVSYDFSIQNAADPFTEPLNFSPYVGAGIAIDTGDDDDGDDDDDADVGFLLSAGIDFPLNRQFTATASVNAGFFDEAEVGLLLGIGYNFSGF
ncbi:MAG: hypothetical protein QNJ47_24865 [Nostocaceae cyanobacterium]|nr:hypothetical protein [Nostocaceae cyanobacterium]